MAQLNARFIVEMDAENDTGRLLESVVLVKCIGRGEQNAVIAVLPKKSPHPPQHARVVVDHKDKFLFRQDRWSFCAGEASICWAAAQMDSSRQIEAAGFALLQSNCPALCLLQ